MLCVFGAMPWCKICWVWQGVLWCVLIAPKAPRQWKRGRRLGNGGFGQVFLCYDVDTGRELAVKQVHIYCDSSDVTKVLNNLYCSINGQNVSLKYTYSWRDGQAEYWVVYASLLDVLISRNFQQFWTDRRQMTLSRNL